MNKLYSFRFRIDFKDNLFVLKIEVIEYTEERAKAEVECCLSGKNIELSLLEVKEL